MLIHKKLNDVNLVCAINTKVIPVAAYPMNVCKFTGGELKDLDQVLKRELRSKNMLGKQSSKRGDGRRGIKSLRDIYKETRLRFPCYITCLENKWIKATWRRENTKEEKSIVEEAMKTMQDVEVEIQFEEDNIRIDEELIEEG